ncbi:unnamed protein product [Rotaria socialis]|uniref:Heat shock factor-binding protein 1 n=1 Tax=Rotaria socialis TaxID=392032 RepID=A0A821R5F7_9BILA|nr:unnamed protein product [Rotaria socialis]CAF3316720.1 unnamed protein product [Rotaria socialis]CAF3651424.1 unnamed protein product [Rotaria socialis]CAF3732704.1 unnamed protein product [Rotaria socialis]CAF4449141.1 unnamed protein product [Rotaria socialis]
MTDIRSVSSSSSSSTTSNNVNHIANSNSSAIPDIDNMNNLTTYVNTIFRQMEEKFMATSDQVMNRMNELGRRIDTLETSITDIISYLPTEEPNSTAQQQSKS